MTGDYNSGTLLVWDFLEGKVTNELIGHNKDDTIFSICLSKDERLICSGSDDKTIKIWENPV